jgi:FkbM family methyltransferase
MKLGQQAARRMLRRFGFDVVRYTPERFAHLRRLALIRSNDVSLVLDVGANTGQWARRLRNDGYRGRLVSFEPLADAFATLNEVAASDPLWECYRLALGDRDGLANIRIAANSWSSSLLPMEDRHIRSAPDAAYQRDEEISIARLDSLSPEIIRRSDRLFVKLDVQGYELPALLGAETVLSRMQVLEVELSLVPLYEGQALLPELVSHLHERNLDLVGIQPAFIDPSNDQILQVDGLFVRRPE